MLNLLTGSLLISVLHALLPNHWLPVLAIGKKEHWTVAATTRVTLIAALAHGGGTVLLGIVLGLVGIQLSATITEFTPFIAPALLILFGLYYIFQHYRHHHFHLHGHPENVDKNKLVAALAGSMFFSPCFEIEGYFLVAGSYGLSFVLLLAVVYVAVTVAGMVIWVRWAYTHVSKMNWHKLEHNAGIITGLTLVASGILAFWLR